MKTRLLILSFALASCVGCCTRPGEEQIRQWAKNEIPPGSSEEDVRRFCQVHGFQYHPGNPGEGWALSPGCGLVPEHVDTFVKYDESGRVETTETHLVNMLP